MRKVSQHYEVNGPIAELERAKQGEVIFYREPELSARRLHDGDGRVRRSVRQVERPAVTVEVPEARIRAAAHEQPGARQARRKVA